MRTKFFVLLSLFVWQTAIALTPAVPPLEVRPEHSGSWYNPDQSGHGFSIEVISEERSIAFWYTYDSSGKPIFLLADGKNFGKKIEATVYYFEGMIWGEFDPADNQRQEWGTLEIEFHDCQNATLAYNPTMPGFSAGEMPLYQLASNEHLRCGESPMAGFYSIALTDDIQSAFVRGMGVLDFDGRLTASFSPKNDMFFDAKIDFTGARNGTAVLSGDSAFIEGDSFSVGPVYLPGWYNPDVITLYSTNFKIEMHHYTGLSATHIEQEAISGDWRLEMTGSGEEWYDVTIESDGSFQFTDGAACLWVGKMTVSKPGFALLDVEAQSTQCDSSVPMQKSTGIYMRQGLHEGADTIRVAFFDEDVGPMFFELIRIPNPLK